VQEEERHAPSREEAASREDGLLAPLSELDQCSEPSLPFSERAGGSDAADGKARSNWSAERGLGKVKTSLAILGAWRNTFGNPLKTYDTSAISQFHTVRPAIRRLAHHPSGRTIPCVA
jgi:hypothetical protein